MARNADTVFGIPWAFGPNPLVYDTTKVRPAPTSWAIAFDPKYRGKVTMQDDIATLWMVAQLLGMDDPNDRSKLYNLTDEQLAQVHTKALTLRPQVRKYWATAGDMVQLFQGGEVVMGEGWPLMTAQLRAAGFPAGEVIPQEGTTAWADHWVMTRGAKNLNAAYAWLEYTAQPSTQKLMADITNYIVANPAAKTYMTPQQVATQRDIADYGMLVNFWQWSPRRDKYQEVWNQVKAGQ
jgi:putative spermidine/putrescine transport system substrate-binding protein/spermidine/putrescine transport system substrate-binding protein